MKRLWIVLCVVLLVGSQTMIALADPTATPTPTNTPLATQYQSGCSLPFNPCGALPWSVPRLATVALRSPTAIPTLPSPTPVPATATPTDTLTPTYTLTPSNTPSGASATPTANIQSGGEPLATLADGLGDMSGTLIAQATHQIMIDGTPNGPAELASKLGSYTGTFFGIVNAFAQFNSYTFGLFSFLLLVLAFRLLVIITTAIGPIILAFIKLLLQLWQAIKPSWLCIAFILLLLFAAPITVQADPTATPTSAIPTGSFGGLRPTPTAWSVTPQASGFDFDADTRAGELADSVINAYRFLNFGATEEHGGILDLLIFIIMLLLVIQVLLTLVTGGDEGDG